MRIEAGIAVGLIENFIARYTKEYDFYSQAAQLVAQILERDLRNSGVRCIVTHRAKDIARLEDKCRQRLRRKNYTSVESIFDDIVDLAGVRVALYFPGEQGQAENLVTRLFTILETKAEFADTENDQADRRFSGYEAVHYRVRLKENELNGLDKRYTKARVEIQVASVLMHAWSEVQHDLVYKPLNGDLSAQELAILDQLNGLVIAGEISLKMLQEAGETRVASNERDFLNHYELAAHLLSHASGLLDEPVGDSGLGRVDRLFALLAKLDKRTPANLAPYLKSLHKNLEKRPLAEQVIDALLAEDSSRYVSLSSIDGEVYSPADGQNAEEEALHRQIGVFLSSWIQLEELMRKMFSAEGKSEEDSFVPTSALIRGLTGIEEPIKREIDLLRRTRNNVVHGRNMPGAGLLMEATERVQAIAHYLNSNHNGDG
ncbi:RelA/SpoT domain-containing protein [Streptomyces sp. MS2.AVA.5]|uniref:RelA/SpoT domain-containing protein n=1 Tax=Streptomyces achmelvichensis TaxID=3134111 RepID=A0ACC6PYC3_9ACTN